MKRPLTSSLMLLALVLSLTTESAIAAEDLTSLRQKITNNLHSIGSIEIRYQVTSQIPKAANLQRFFPPGSEKPQSSVWAKQGAKEFYELEPRIVAGKTDRTLRSFDGRQYLQFQFTPGDATAVQRADVRNLPPGEAFDDAIISILIGLRVPDTPLSLVDLLARPAARFEGEEEVEGHRCHKIESGEFEGYGGTIRRLTIWVEPKFDYLPRKLAPYLVRDSKNELWPPRTVPYTITEYFEVEDSVLGRKRWLPKKAKYTEEIEVLTASVNPVFASDRFTPLIPAGAHVVYWDQRVPVPVPGSTQTRVRHEIMGGATGQAIARERAEADAFRRQQAQMTLNQQAESARQKKTWSLAAVSVLTIAFGVFAVWKRFRL